jgi:hypothetical protein
VTTIRAAFAKSAPQLAVALAILGLFTAAAYTGHAAEAVAAGVIGTLIGLVGVVTVAVLQSPQPNSDLIPHLFFTLCVVAAVGVLLFHNVFTDAIATSLLAPVLGGGLVVAGANANTNAIKSLTPDLPLGGDPGSSAGPAQATPPAPATIPATFAAETLPAGTQVVLADSTAVSPTT